MGYPLGIGYIGAYLESQGHDVEIFDNNQKCYQKSDLAKHFRNSDAEIIGISSMVSTYNQVMQICRLMKETINVPIILGGPMATYSPETVLRNMDIDICVLGEGEETANDLFSSWPNYKNVPGIAYINNNDKFVNTPPRVFQKTRDDYPYPGYDSLLDITKYWRKALPTWELLDNYKDMTLLNSNHPKYVNRKPDFKIATMLTGMGCPYKCTFCTNSTIFMKTRVRTPENVAAEALHLKKKFGISAIRFEDDLLILHKDRTLELARELKKTDLLWGGQSVGRATADEEVVSAIADAGCVGFGIGIESGSDRLLKAMMKGSRSKDYADAYYNAIKYKVGIRVQLLYGSPGESRETLQETIDFFKETGLPPRRLNRLWPMPGSGVYDQCLEQGIIYDEHAYLNMTSSLGGYTSRNMTFNITGMSDEEYFSNLIWIESELFNNYDKIVKNRKGYFFNKILYHYIPTMGKYLIKIVKVTPVLRKLKQMIITRNYFLWNKLKQSKKTERQRTNYLDYITIYPEMNPDSTVDDLGFKNSTLKDKRIDKIFQKVA
jgi:radical SAM superfamily enzyme YgiQ (UPF0313 family)